MLKSKALFTALLLTLSFNTFAFCVHNQTSKPVYFSSDQDWLGERTKKIVPGDKHCTKPSEAGFGYSIIDNDAKNMDDANLICGALWTNISLKDIHVIPDGEYQTCVIS